MNACELTAAITAAAKTLACKLTDDELSVLGVALTQLGGYPADHRHRQKPVQVTKTGHP